MIKSSKLFSGTASTIPATTLHASPVSSNSPAVSPQNNVGVASPAQLSFVNLSNSIQKVPVVSIKPPILVKQLEIPNLFQDSVDAEVASPSRQDQKVFSQYTGLSENEPSILLMSEFIPIYSGNQKNNQGKSLSFKENSKIISAKTAINILNQNKDTKDFINSNKKELSDYIAKEDSFLNQAVRITSRTHEALDISSYAVPIFVTKNSVGSLYEILKKSGYSSENITKYTETKLWNQSLLEVKRDILSHTPDLVSTKFSRKNIQSDSDPFVLSDVDKPPQELKRIWLNPYLSLPKTQDLTVLDNINDNVENIVKFDEKKYVNLSDANTEKNIKQKIASSRNFVGLIESFSTSGRDISISANSLFKEGIYSSYILKSENSSNIEYKFGYRSSLTGDNVQIWDHVIGRFPRSVLEFSKNPVGNGKSLASFSQEIASQGEDSYNVLTFENNIFESAGITPGASYYIDSSLMTKDGVSFDTAKLDQLINKTKEAHETSKTVIEMMGYDIQRVYETAGFDERYRKRYEGLFSLEDLSDRLSSVSLTYQNCLVISNLDEVDSLNTSFMRPGNGLTPDESIGIRLAALICKAAVYPSKNYEKTSSKLKSLLFLWLLNVSLKQLDPSIDNESTVRELKRKISTHFSSISVSASPRDISVATEESRTFPISTGNSPDVNTYVQTINDSSVVREKKSAFESYIQSVGGRLFEIDANKGIWSEIVGLLKELLMINFFFIGDYTGYSGIAKTGYIFGYFDLILRVIASQTPENLLGSYSSSYEYVSLSKKITISETGLLVDRVSKNQLSDFYNARYIKNGYKPRRYIRKLSDAILFLKSEDDSIISKVAVFRKYLLDLSSSLNSFRTFLKTNFENHISTIKNLYDSDESLSVNQKISLMNMSFSEEQIRLSRYIMSEISDRIKETNEMEGKLKSIPSLSDFPQGFSEFLPLNETDMVSHTLLSSYFKSVEFLKERGNNKKILSVGIPPRLNRRLRTIMRTASSGEKSVKENLIRMKVYKIDRLHPDIVYLPKSYMFEMNRFPTRVLGNWNYNSLIEDDFNLLNIPSKLICSDGSILSQKDFTEAFPQSIYGNILLDEEKFQVYVNHAVSFLSEEYLRWFTDVHFDESRYFNFSNMSDSSNYSDSQFKKYLEFAKNYSKTQSLSTQIKARFTDPTSKESFEIPVNSPDSDGMAAGTTTSANTKTYTIPMDNTVLSFFSNETFVLNIEDIKRRMVYMKKFDRVFNVIFDPDDFYVDTSVSPKTSVESLKKLGVLVGGDQGSSRKSLSYKNRDTSQEDVTLDEYFVTIEPYDYV